MVYEVFFKQAIVEKGAHKLCVVDALIKRFPLAQSPIQT